MCRDVNFKSKIPQDLVETSNDTSKNLKRKGKIKKKKKLKHFVIHYKKATNLGNLYLLPKCIESYTMCWGDQSFPTVVHQHRKFLSS